MLDTSKDLLYIVLTFCIALLTFFLCWALYYIVMMLKRGNEALTAITETVSSVKEKIERLEKLFDTIEEKVSHTASYVPLVFKGVTELIDYLKKKKEQRRRTKAV